MSEDSDLRRAWIRKFLELSDEEQVSFVAETNRVLAEERERQRSEASAERGARAVHAVDQCGETARVIISLAVAGRELVETRSSSDEDWATIAYYTADLLAVIRERAEALAEALAAAS